MMRGMLLLSAMASFGVVSSADNSLLIEETSTALETRMVSGLKVDIPILPEKETSSPLTILDEIKAQDPFNARMVLQETAPITMLGPFGAIIDPFESIRDSDFAKSYLRVYAESLHSGNWQASYELALRRFNEDPDNPNVLSTLASLSALRADYPSAVKYFLLYLAHDPESIHPLGGLAHALFFTARFEEAGVVLDRLREINPDFLPARFTRAALLVATHRPDDEHERWDITPVGDLEQIASWLHGDRVALRQVLGTRGYTRLCTMLLGEGTEENLLLLPDALKQARTALLARQWHKALVFYELASGYGLRSVTVQQQRARCMYETGRGVDALKVMYDLSLRYPSVPEVWYNLGYLLIQTEAASAAHDALKVAVETAPNRGDFLFAYACALAINNRLDEAWEILYRILPEHHAMLPLWLEGDTYYLRPFHTDARYPAFMREVELRNTQSRQVP